MSKFKKQRILSFSIAIFAMLLSLGLLIYPFLSNYITEKNCSEIRAEYYETVEMVDNDTLNGLMEAAKKYNASLNSIRFENDSIKEAQTNYNELLNINGDGIMGYIEIPRINVYLPIFHGTGAESLNNGVGHLIGSSLPVGGAGTHTVLTGHSGVVGKRLFSDLDQLKVGDFFYLHILSEKLVYKVTELHTVEPSDTSLLTIKQGKDRCTLITCTPFGVNTHRLLVQADRIFSTDVQPLLDTDVQSFPPLSSTWRENYYTGLFGGGLIAISLTLVLVICSRLKTKILRVNSDEKKTNKNRRK